MSDVSILLGIATQRRVEQILGRTLDAFERVAVAQSVIEVLAVVEGAGDDPIRSLDQWLELEAAL